MWGRHVNLKVLVCSEQNSTNVLCNCVSVIHESVYNKVRKRKCDVCPGKPNYIRTLRNTHLCRLGWWYGVWQSAWNALHLLGAVLRVSKTFLYLYRDVCQAWWCAEMSGSRVWVGKFVGNALVHVA